MVIFHSLKDSVTEMVILNKNNTLMDIGAHYSRYIIYKHNVTELFVLLCTVAFQGTKKELNIKCILGVTRCSPDTFVNYYFSLSISQTVPKENE